MVRPLALSRLLLATLLSVQASAATFTIVSELSVLTAVPNPTLLEQSPGSLSVDLQGTLEALVTAHAISFPGGSHVDFITKLSSFSPLGTPANLAGSGVLYNAAMRQASLDFFTDASSPTPFIVDLSDPNPPPGGAFDATGLLQFISGGVDVGGPIIDGGLIQVNLLDVSAFANQPISFGSYNPLNPGMALVIPIDGVATVLNNAVGTISVRFTGQIVAASSVPEPSGSSLAMLTAFGVIWRRRRDR